jgi:formylglycine-generating enzyme required for sulfatase activity
MKIAREFRWGRLAWACAIAVVQAVACADPAPGEPWVEPGTGMRFVWVPGGCFVMGSNNNYAYERPAHKVCVKGFYLGVFEVTQGQYRKVMGKNPSDNQGDDNLPVESVNWNDAVAMSQKLAQSSGKTIRLPTEAEWEYACRAADRHDPYCGDGRLADLAWYDRNSDTHSQPVGKKAPNAWGLYDMTGNVWEWTLDCWHDNYYGAPADGSAWNTGGDCRIRVARGGSWGTVGDSTRASVRNSDLAALDFVDTGFRLLRQP